MNRTASSQNGGEKGEHGGNYVFKMAVRTPVGHGHKETVKPPGTLGSGERRRQLPCRVLEQGTRPAQAAQFGDHRRWHREVPGTLVPRSVSCTSDAVGSPCSVA
jgi:hypothetical protein